MTATLFQQSLVRAVDDNGRPISGAKMYFHTTGTLTAATWYLDGDGTTPGTNPHEADASGKFDPVFLDDGIVYRVVLKTSTGTTIWDADPVGSEVQVFIASGTGAVSRQITSKLQDEVSILDFIPESLHAAIKARTSTTDLSLYVANAIAAIDANDGGGLYWPAGTYNVNSATQLCRNLTMRGAGIEATIVKGSHTGTAGANSVSIPSGSLFKNVETINGSHRCFITVSDMTLNLTSASNLGACFYSQCSTFLNFKSVAFIGGKYGLIRDQDEISSETDCVFESQLSGGIGLWYVNGPDINASALALFTNQLKNVGCQFNQSSAYAIVHDGGYDWCCISPNLNGGGVRFAGVQPGMFIAGEYESVTGRPVMQVSTTTLSGGSSGSGYLTVDGGVWASVAGQVAINISGASAFELRGTPIFAVANSGGVTSCITGAANCGSLVTNGLAQSTYSGSGVSVLDGYATLHYGPRPAVRTESGTSITGTLSHTESIVLFSNGAAKTFTVPPNASVAYEVGTRIYLVQSGAGKLTVAPGAGVTIDAEGGLYSAKAQYTRLVLEKTATNTWSLSGDRIA